MERLSYVYMLASQRNGTLYVGVTSHLARRVYEHREGLIQGFTAKYAVKMLVWYEVFYDVREAIAAEKRIKRWRRRWKLERSSATTRNGGTSTSNSSPGGVFG